MNRVLPLILGLLTSLAGCAGDPDLAAHEDELVPGPEVARVDWEAAAPGCEGVDGELRACAGEPLLGALVGPGGLVRCVDALGVLRAERRAQIHEDPTPTPLTPAPTLEGDWL